MVKSLFKPFYFVALFVIIVFADLIAGSLESMNLRHYTKPLILLSLFLYFAYNGKFLGKAVYMLMLAALFFSWLGDVMLMYDHISGSYFVLGLVFFLVAHILYIILFLQNWNRTNSNSFFVVFLLLLIYGGFLFFQMKDNLGKLQIPVAVYIIVILSMAITAFRRKEMVNRKSFVLVLLGALLFITSDSLLAINKFMTNLAYSNILVMATYAAAQYLIVKGILHQKEVSQQ
ncbi:lysoplasmalogenase [Maribacter sp. HTCC2170]|uniref:lysoplasmalogenase n=1 Tax=Maribacter sp. (strain HTCC2170 / KCCM 42371) TaxID=313603 RepID=UPI00006BB862|nr:lysoplasmalogenase [Maribacter sp. HTCC2170]EAQ99719.1 hypothetical protein FB2170_10414 [Maribacter sp. HTCC2170]